MDPAARHAAAIEVIDEIARGTRAATALRDWGRAHRFAGSGDRRAIGDVVHDVLRHWWSSAALGGGEEGRARVIGLMRMQGTPPGEVFTGIGHAPPPLTATEAIAPDVPVPSDLPPLVEPMLRPLYGDRFEALATAMRQRAPLDLRANLLATDREGARAALGVEGIEAAPCDLSPTALRLPPGDRRIAASRAYREGLVELQDAASQAVTDFAKARPGERILDYCTGAGGKALALAGHARGPVSVHDIAPARMRDLPARAARAGAGLRPLRSADLPRGAFDLVFADAPCSGSGSWRRDPEGKLHLDARTLDTLRGAQADVLDTAAALVAPGGRLVYATCSLLEVENEGAVNAFLARAPQWRQVRAMRLDPLTGGDGFFASWLEPTAPL